MKTIRFKPLRNVIAICALSLTFASCEKEVFDNGGGGDPTYTTSAQANGQQTTPPTTTSASGTLFGEYNATTNNWEYRINWSSLSTAATAVQIHGPAEVGIAGQMQVALAITTPGVSGNAQGSVTLTEEQEAYLLANRLYFTVINATNVNGEIRGQIIANRVH